MAKKLVYATAAEARRAFEQYRPVFEERGVTYQGASSFVPEPFRYNWDMAMDAAPAFIPTIQTDPNSGIPVMLTTYIDPDVYEILFSPTKSVDVLGEERKGNWVMDTAMFPVVEHTGEVSSYGDRNNNGRAGANTDWPNRQNYIWQTIIEYGDREVERAGLGKINWTSELNAAAATVLNRYANLVNLFGVSGLLNFGLTNDPNLPAAIAPAPKANGGSGWFTSPTGGTPNATANEVYNDIVTMYELLVQNNNGLVDKDTQLVLVMSPGSEVALTFTNSFNVNVQELLEKNFKKLKIVTVPQYGVQTSSNSQGIVAGNLVQLIAESIEGQDTGYCAFSEKLRSFPIKRELSSYRQKQISGGWGAIIRMPIAYTQMIGV